MGKKKNKDFEKNKNKKTKETSSKKPNKAKNPQKIKQYIKTQKEPIIKGRNFPRVIEVDGYGFILRTFKTKDKGQSFLCYEISGVDIWTKDISEQHMAINGFTGLIQSIFYTGYNAHILVSNSFSELNDVLKNSRLITKNNINANNPKFAYAAMQTTKEIKEIQQTDEDLKLLAQFSADKKSYHLIVGIGDVTGKKSIQDAIAKLSGVVYGFAGRVGSEIKLLGELPKTMDSLASNDEYKEFKKLQKKLFKDAEKIDPFEKKFLDSCLNVYSKLDRVVGTMLTGYNIRSNSLVEIVERMYGLEMKLNVAVNDFNPSNDVSHVDKIIRKNYIRKLKGRNDLNEAEKEELDRELNPDRYTRVLQTKKLISIYRTTIKVKEFSRGTTASWLSDLAEMDGQYIHAVNAKISGFKVIDQQFIKKVEHLIYEASIKSQELQRAGKLVDAVTEEKKADDWHSIVTGSDIDKRDIINTTVSISFNYYTKEALENHLMKLRSFVSESKIPNDDEHVPSVSFSKIRHASELMGAIRKFPILKEIRENKWNQIKAFENNGLPYLTFKRNDLKPTKTFLTESIYLPETTFALAYPFLSGSFIQPTGLPIGSILGTNEPIIIDPTRKSKRASNSNIVVFGTSGSGKSTLAKKLAKIITLLNAQVIIFDPENENSMLANNLNGEIITIGKEVEGGSYNTINPFQTMVSKTEKVLRNLPVWVLNLLDYKFFENSEPTIRRLMLKNKGQNNRNLSAVINRLRQISKLFKQRKKFFIKFLEIIFFDHESYRQVATYQRIIETATSYIFSYEIIERIKAKEELGVERLFQGKIADVEKLIREEDYHFPNSLSGLADSNRKVPTTEPKFPNNTQKELKDTCDFLSYPANYEDWNKPTTIKMTNNLTNLALKGIFSADITKREKNAWMYLLLSFIDDHVDSKENRLSDEVKARMRTQKYKEERKRLRDRFERTLEARGLSDKAKQEELNIFENESDYNECKAINVVVDEAHLMIDEQNPIALRYFSGFTKRIRKRNGFITFITQNVADFVPEGNSQIKKYSTAIVNNTQYFFVFNLSKNDLNAFLTLFENGKLSEQEIHSITVAEPGEGLFIHGTREKTMIKVNVENDYNIIGVSVVSPNGIEVRKARNVEEIDEYMRLAEDLKEAHSLGELKLSIEDID